MRVQALVVAAVLLVPVSALAGGGKQRVRAVIDHVVDGKVVRRTVVTGPRRKSSRLFVGFERERAAAGKGWSVTDHRAAPPRDLRLGGRLEETGARAQQNGQTIIKLERPGAHRLKGEREIRVYSRGRVTKIKKMGKVHEPQVEAVSHAAVSARAAATPAASVVRSDLLVDILGDITWNTMPGLALRYDPSEPYSVHLDIPNQPSWTFSRELVADALAHGRSGEGDVQLIANGGYLEMELSSPEGSARIRTPRELVRDFLERAHASVPPGTESQHLDLERELRNLFGEP